MTARSTSLHTTANLLAKTAPAFPQLRVAPHPQLIKLEALRAACDRALLSASRGDLFASVEGVRVCNAAFDVFECDALYDLALDVDAPFGTMGS